MAGLSKTLGTVFLSASFCFFAACMEACNGFDDKNTEDMADWLSISPSSGIGNGTFNVTAEKNTSTEARTATVTVTTLGGLSRTVTVTQQGVPVEEYINFDTPDITVEVVPSDFVTDEEVIVRTATVKLYSNASWTIDNTSDWVSLSETSGKGDKEITVTMTLEKDVYTRTAVEFTATTPTGKTATFTVLLIDGRYIEPVTGMLGSITIKSDGSESSAVSRLKCNALNIEEIKVTCYNSISMYFNVDWALSKYNVDGYYEVTITASVNDYGKTALSESFDDYSFGFAATFGNSSCSWEVPIKYVKV